MNGEIILGAVISLVTTVTVVFVQANVNRILEKNKKELIRKIYYKKIEAYDQLMIAFSKLKMKLQCLDDIMIDGFDIESDEISNCLNIVLENYEKYEIYFASGFMNRLSGITYYTNILIKLLRIYENNISLEKLEYIGKCIINSRYEIKNIDDYKDLKELIIKYALHIESDISNFKTDIKFDDELLHMIELVGGNEHKAFARLLPDGSYVIDYGKNRRRLKF